MYERNAIVLERYFYKLFKFKEDSNLRENYNNYCNLLENFENFTKKTEAERIAIDEFEKASENIRKIQKTRRKIV